MSSVLLVDDDLDILDSVKTVLELAIEGVEVRTAASGKAGLAMLREAPVELIISDFRMPEMDGAEFLEQAETVRPGTPRILISAFPEAILKERVESRVRIDHVLPKPMDVDELIGITQGFLSKPDAAA